MKIRIYEVNQNTGVETFDSECELHEALDPKGEDYLEAALVLAAWRSYLIGGGASPLVRLERVQK